jgi:hypothetical protein
MAMPVRATLAIGEAGDAAGKTNQDRKAPGGGRLPSLFYDLAGAAAGFGSGLSCLLDQEM